MTRLARPVLAAAVSAALVACGSGDAVEGTAGTPSENTSSVAEINDDLLRAPDLATANSRADLNVTVSARRWTWTFSYTKGGTGQTQAVWEQGSPEDLPQLWLVEDSSVNFTLHSADVIHSFWLPELLTKMDVVPGRESTNYFTAVPQEAGTFVGRCAELCGQFHSKMLFDARVVSQAEFDRHLQELEDAGQTGVNLPDAVPYVE